MHAASDSLIPWAKRLGFTATVLAAAAASQFGWAMGSGNWIKGATLAGFCILAAAIVGYALVFARRAAHEQKWGVCVVAVVLFAGAVLVELLGAFGFNAAARSQNVTSANHTASVYTDIRSEIERKQADLSALPAGRAPAAISADMASIETRSWFQATNSCATPGSYGNSCRRYQALKGELATSQARAAIDKDLRDLRAKAATADTGHSDVGAQNRIVASAFVGAMKPSAEQEYWSFVAVSAIFAVFMAMSSLLNFLAYAFDPEPETTADRRSADVIKLPHDDTAWARAVLKGAVKAA